MTAKFYKNVYQKIYLPNKFWLRILGNKMDGDYTELDFKVT